MNNQETGYGWWLNAEGYSQIAEGFAGIKARYVITHNIIREKLKSGPIKVLSLGIGTATLYKSFFEQEIQENKLQLFGVDILESMILASQKQVPNAVLKIGNLLSFDQLFSGKFDIIEAGLVLHHTLRFEELSQLIKKIYNSLNPDGLFILGDIDIICGECIEEKLIKLEKEHGPLSVDHSSGEFFNDNIRLPIFSLDNDEDKKVLRRLKIFSSIPLMKVLGNLIPEQEEKLKPMVLKDIESNNKGLEWFRGVNSPAGWKALIRNSFMPCKELNILLPDAIKAGFPEVLDNPFVLVAKK